MQTDGNTINLLGLDERRLETFFTGIGEKPYRSRQVLAWMHRRGVDRFDAMTDLSLALRSRLERLAEIRLPEVIAEQKSADGTVKWLFDAGRGQAVESVFIPEPERGTLCISSQVGCVLDCAFCATGEQSFNRNLNVAEIIGQVCHAGRSLPRRPGGEAAVTNVVFMGMGEPLANYRNLVPALELLISDRAYGLSRRRVTVSTSGLVPQMERLGQECNVSLAVSLHAPDDDLRSRLVPINRIHPIAELLDACWRYASRHASRHITFEYVMLDGVNDSPEHAERLAGLLHNRPAKVNLIPFNPYPGSTFRRSPPETVEAFQNRLRQRGLVATVRRTRGDDIDAACGQLAGKVSDRIRTRLSEKNQKAPGHPLKVATA